MRKISNCLTVYEIKINILVCMCIFALNSIRKYKKVIFSLFCTGKLCVFSFITQMSYKEMVQFKGDFFVAQQPYSGQDPPLLKSRVHTQTFHNR